MKKFNNKYTGWLVLVSLFAVLSSCTEKLDIKPKQSIDSEIALSTPENIKTALVGAYYTARSQNIFGSYFTEVSELYAASGDMLFMGTFEEPAEFINKEATTTNQFVEAMWISAYNLINDCNTLLDPGVLEILDEDDQDIVEGEARFLRGWVLFELTRLFSLPYEAGVTNSQPGVPIILNPTKDAVNAVKVARNTVEQCYAQVLEDLTAARDLLPPENDVYATTFAASAVLARVHLQMGNYAGAAAEANTVIEDGSYSLMPSVRQAFNNPENSSEDIFALQQNVASNDSWLPVMYASLNGTGRGDYEIQQVFLDRFDPADERGMLQEDTDPSFTIENISEMYYIGVGTIVNSGGINTAKYGSYFTNISLIRLAEMYLIRAEANYEDPGTDIGPNTPTQDVNLIRERAKAPVYLSPVTREQIREERYLELCWEGFRLHDLKRWKANIGTLPYDAGNLILPVPFREMQVNDLLEQNDWYTGS